MWLAPPRPHSKRIRHTRVHEGVDAVRLAGSLIRACHQGISFALLDEVKEGFTGKLLFDGLCLTGLISRACAGNQSAKSHSNSEGFHWLLPSPEGALISCPGSEEQATQLAMDRGVPGSSSPCPCDYAGDDYPLEFYEDGYPKLPSCLDRRASKT